MKEMWILSKGEIKASGKIKVLGENTLPVLLSPPWISHGLAWALNSGFQVTDRRHGTSWQSFISSSKLSSSGYHSIPV